MILTIINKKAIGKFLLLIKLNNIKSFEKNPLKGGIPAIENKTNKKEKAFKEFILNIFDKLEMNKETLDLVKNFELL